MCTNGKAMYILTWIILYINNFYIDAGRDKKPHYINRGIIILIFQKRYHHFLCFFSKFSIQCQVAFLKEIVIKIKASTILIPDLLFYIFV